MGVQVTTRNVTNNQSTADFLITRFCLRDNRYINGPLKNGGGAPITVKPASLVMRDTAVAGGFLPILLAADLAKVVGVTVNETDSVIAAGASKQTNFVNKGEINGTLLILPEAATLDTVVGNFSVRDLLEQLGLKVNTNVVDHTFYDN